MRAVRVLWAGAASLLLGAATFASACSDSGVFVAAGDDAGDFVGGNGAVQLSAAALDFGGADCGGAAVAPKTLRIRNAGTTPLTYSAKLDRTTTFTLVGTATGTLQPGAMGILTVSAPPLSQESTAGATIQAALEITTNDPGFPTVVVPVKITPQGAALRVVPGTVDFGEVALNQNEDLPVTITNVGNAPASVHLDGPTGDFSLSWDSSHDVVVQPNATVAGAVAHFHPTNTNPQTASVALRVSSPTCAGSASAIPVKGVGTTGQATVGPGSLDFSLVNCGSQSGEQTVRLKNWGAATFTWATALGKGASSPYTLNPSNGQLPPGATVTITVQPKAITPPAATDYNAFGDTLLITTNVPDDKPHNVNLIETAQGAVLTVSPTTIAFGDVQVGQSASSPFTVSNAGNIAADVKLAASPAMFRAQPPEVMLPPASASGGQASFTPPAPGAHSGSITLSTTAIQCSVNPGPIALSGNGTTNPPPPPPPDAGQDASPPPPDAAADTAPPPQDSGPPDATPDASTPPDAGAPDAPQDTGAADGGAPADAPNNG